ncbi:phage terminase large subunit [Methylocella sp. CPCC 101449]|uniref:phage terminase large subunit n=1 Tax=Methylocella sp. CPCC 101449 TaxID=2987531 RepID=UPI0028923CEA|nr:phage terminase large subunit [Methylocella sp. CPCC 101449]MDT2021227.1 phage terminase large subunit [Methylocella sp. CPCC 101449]
MTNRSSQRLLTFQEYKAALKRDPTAFMQRSFHALHATQYLYSDYHDLIMSTLKECLTGNIKRLIINAPPRGIKSHAVSVSFVAWALANNPALKFILASYSMDLAQTLARETRTLMEHPFYKAITTTRISPHRKALNDFYTTAGGFRMSTSPDGTLTGRGCNIFIIDDIMKADEALSPAVRKSRIEWYENTVVSRLNSKKDGVIIIVMQRLHQDDLCGHLLRTGKWKHLCFPAIAEEDIEIPYRGIYGDYKFVRKKGELLHPEREDRAAIERIRKEISFYNYTSQYQQNPAPESGHIVKKEWLKYYSDLPSGRPLNILQSWDTANKASELSDYSVCTTWHQYGDDYYLIDVLRQRLDYPSLRKAIKQQADKFSPHSIRIEDRASGSSLIQDISSEVSGVLAYLPPPGADKIMRLHACSHIFESGRVYLPQSASWLDAYINELMGFPGGSHDDQVDSTTQALDVLKTPDTLSLLIKIGQNEREFLEKSGRLTNPLRFPF